MDATTVLAEGVAASRIARLESLVVKLYETQSVSLQALQLEFATCVSQLSLRVAALEDASLQSRPTVRQALASLCVDGSVGGVKHAIRVLQKGEALSKCTASTVDVRVQLGTSISHPPPHAGSSVTNDQPIQQPRCTPAVSAVIDALDNEDPHGVSGDLYGLGTLSAILEAETTRLMGSARTSASASASARDSPMTLRDLTDPRPLRWSPELTSASASTPAYASSTTRRGWVDRAAERVHERVRLAFNTPADASSTGDRRSNRHASLSPPRTSSSGRRGTGTGTGSSRVRSLSIDTGNTGTHHRGSQPLLTATPAFGPASGTRFISPMGTGASLLSCSPRTPPVNAAPQTRPHAHAAASPASRGVMHASPLPLASPISWLSSPSPIAHNAQRQATDPRPPPTGTATTGTTRTTGMPKARVRVTHAESNARGALAYMAAQEPYPAVTVPTPTPIPQQHTHAEVEAEADEQYVAVRASMAEARGFEAMTHHLVPSQLSDPTGTAHGSGHRASADQSAYSGGDGRTIDSGHNDHEAYDDHWQGVGVSRGSSVASDAHSCHSDVEGDIGREHRYGCEATAQGAPPSRRSSVVSATDMACSTPVPAFLRPSQAMHTTTGLAGGDTDDATLGAEASSETWDRRRRESRGALAAAATRETVVRNHYHHAHHQHTTTVVHEGSEGVSREQYDSLRATAGALQERVTSLEQALQVLMLDRQQHTAVQRPVAAPPPAPPPKRPASIYTPQTTAAQAQLSPIEADARPTEGALAAAASTTPGAPVAVTVEAVKQAPTLRVPPRFKAVARRLPSPAAVPVPQVDAHVTDGSSAGAYGAQPASRPGATDGGGPLMHEHRHTEGIVASRGDGASHFTAGGKDQTIARHGLAARAPMYDSDDTLASTMAVSASSDVLEAPESAAAATHTGRARVSIPSVPHARGVPGRSRLSHAHVQASSRNLVPTTLQSLGNAIRRATFPKRT